MTRCRVAAVAVFVVAVGTSCAGSADSDPTALPSGPGTYANAPTQLWSNETSNSMLTVALATDSDVVTADYDFRGRPDNPTTLTSRNLSTGEVTWSVDGPRVMCGTDEGDQVRTETSLIRHRAGSSFLICERATPGADNYETTLVFFDASDGSEVATMDGFALGSSALAVDDTVYTCLLEDDGVVVRSGVPSDPAAYWSTSLSADLSRVCTLTVEDTFVVVSDPEWSAILDSDGRVLHESPGASTRPLGDDLFFQSNAVGMNPAVITGSGDTVVEPKPRALPLRSRSGSEDAPLVADGNDAVLDAATGDVLWAYDAPYVAHGIGRFGDVAVFYEDESRLAGYDTGSGEQLWAITLDELGLSAATPDYREAAFTALETAVSDGRYLVVAGGGTSLHSLDTETGNVVWTTETRGEIALRTEDALVVAGENSVTAFGFE